jgi:putative spermidine/putrescine transport system substrate-binding protein
VTERETTLPYRTFPRWALLALSLCLLASACAAASPNPGGQPEAAVAAGAADAQVDDASGGPDAAGWPAVQEAAAGQTVRWWMYGGDERVNRYVDEHVVPAAARVGVTLERVPVADTADAVQRVVAELQAGEAAGSIDLIWINGENFAAGKRAGLWLEEWAGRLPNARYIDPATADTDFGLAVEGQESPWSRALFVYAYDTARMPRPPRTLDDLLAYARDHPGRLTYPAPPDFTGSAFVRQVVQALGEEEGFVYLRQLEPLLWREGQVHPGSEAELNRLFGDGQVDLAMSYDPSFVETAVRQGTFSETARPFVLDHGTLHNVSYVTVPVNAASPEGALVVADVLLDPELQARKADPDILGAPTVLDPDRLAVADRRRLERRSDSPYLLSDLGRLVDELPVDRVESLEQRWHAEVLP